MKVIELKRQKVEQYDKKSDQTTAINSHTHSRRNSSFLGLSKDSQTLVLPAQKIIFGRQNRRNKKCLNLTVVQNKNNKILSQRRHKEQRKLCFINFNFCQQVSNKENLNTQIVDIQKVQQVFTQHQKALNQKRQKAIFLGKANSTLNAPKSPINQLIKLLDESDDDLTKELDSLLERL